MRKQRSNFLRVNYLEGVDVGFGLRTLDPVYGLGVHRTFWDSWIFAQPLGFLLGSKPPPSEVGVAAVAVEGNPREPERTRRETLQVRATRTFPFPEPPA